VLRLLVVLIVGWVAGGLAPAKALQFEQMPYNGSQVIIVARGAIVEGDESRFSESLANIQQSRQLFALAVDSPGGSLAEAKLIADMIRRQALTVIVPSNSTCASACFLLLAAAPRRFVAVNALVGVHSASENGGETIASLAATTEMARYASEFGVPPLILGKMVQTTPGRVAWLTKSDLVSMGVVVLDNGVAVPPPIVAKARPVGEASSHSFEQGNADRRAWDTWLALQRGAFHDGAAFWASQHDPAHPVSCDSPRGEARDEFSRGCEAARQHLAAADARRASDPEYSRGWNAVFDTAASIARTEAEFRGVFFCARVPASLSLKIVASSDATLQHAILSFGPTSTNHNVAYGVFLVEGRIDLAGGALDLHPVSWVAQPAGYTMVGLLGRSDDGGRTFAGRVTAGASCTLFTLRRLR
jgi:hypothetical protein